ncbi:hypothetical protein ACX12L_04465, partial [Alicycliphilus sp. T452]
YVFNDPGSQNLFQLPNFAAISEALNYDTFFKDLSNFVVFRPPRQLRKPPSLDNSPPPPAKP